MKPRRVLLWSDRSGIFGAERIEHRLALGLHEAGYQVTVAQPEARNELVAARHSVGIAQHDLPLENIYDWRNPAPSLSDPSAARSCFAATRPDFILFSDSFPLANLAAKQEAQRQGRPYLVLVHCVQPEWAQEFAAFLPGLPPLYLAARAVVAVSTDNLLGLRRDFGLPANRGLVIFNGRPSSFFSPADPRERERVRAGLGIPPDSLLALTIGRYEWVKGHDLLLDAILRLRQAAAWERLRFVWVGAGTREAALRLFARMIGTGRVQLLGETADVAPLMDAADLLIHPARFEGMPLVMLEAMAKGLPIVASGIGGSREALGDTGLVVCAPDDTGFRQALADAIARLAADPDLRRDLGDRAKRRAEELFTEGRMLRAYLDLLRECFP